MLYPTDCESLNLDLPLPTTNSIPHGPEPAGGINTAACFAGSHLELQKHQLRSNSVREVFTVLAIYDAFPFHPETPYHHYMTPSIMSLPQHGSHLDLHEHEEIESQKAFPQQEESLSPCHQRQKKVIPCPEPAGGINTAACFAGYKRCFPIHHHRLSTNGLPRLRVNQSMDHIWTSMSFTLSIGQLTTPCQMEDS